MAPKKSARSRKKNLKTGKKLQATKALAIDSFMQFSEPSAGVGSLIKNE